MTDVVFAFGPVDGFFFESQTLWRLKSLPPKLQVLFMSGSSDIAHVYHLVLGAGDSWFISYRTKNGGAAFSHDGLPEKLSAWLRIKDQYGYTVRNVSKLKISLGQGNSSFWAEDGRDFYWDNLPPALTAAVQKLISPTGGWSRIPRLVVLGVYQSFVLITEGGGGNYAVSDYYPLLQRELETLFKSGKPGPLKAVHHISLDQHDRDNFVMTTVFGDVYYNMPDALGNDMKLVQQTIPRTPMGVPAEAKQPETMVSRMPVPQATSVLGFPDSGKAPETSTPTLPQNTGFVQVPTPAPAQEGLYHQKQQAQQTQQQAQQQQQILYTLPSGQQVLIPAAAFNSTVHPQGVQTTASGTPHPPPSAHSVHTNPTPSASLQQQMLLQQQKQQQRPVSPETYQHPHVAALENAAARVASPATIQTTDSLSYAPTLHNPVFQAPAVVSAATPIHAPQASHAPLPPGTGVSQPSQHLVSPQVSAASPSPVQKYVQEQQQLYAASIAAASSTPSASIPAPAGHGAQSAMPLHATMTSLAAPIPTSTPVHAVSPISTSPATNSRPQINTSPAPHAWAPETTATPAPSQQQAAQTTAQPAPAPPSPSDTAPELALSATLFSHAQPLPQTSATELPGVSLSNLQSSIASNTGQGYTPTAPVSSMQMPQSVQTNAQHSQQQQQQQSIQQFNNALLLQHQLRMSTPQHGAIPYMPPSASPSQSVSPPPLVHAHTTTSVPLRPHSTAATMPVPNRYNSVTGGVSAAESSSSISPPPASPSAVPPRHNSASGGSTRQFLSGFGKGFKNTLKTTAKNMVPKNASAAGSALASSLFAGGMAEITGKDPTTAMAGAMVNATQKANALQSKQQAQAQVAAMQTTSTAATQAPNSAQHAASAQTQGMLQTHPGLSASVQGQTLQQLHAGALSNEVQAQLAQQMLASLQHPANGQQTVQQTHPVMQSPVQAQALPHAVCYSPVHSQASNPATPPAVSYGLTQPQQAQAQFVFQPSLNQTLNMPANLQAIQQTLFQVPVSSQGQPAQTAPIPTQSPPHTYTPQSPPHAYTPQSQPYAYTPQSPPHAYTPMPQSMGLSGPPPRPSTQSPQGHHAGGNSTEINIEIQNQQVQQQQQQVLVQNQQQTIYNQSASPVGQPQIDLQTQLALLQQVQQAQQQQQQQQQQADNAANQALLLQQQADLAQINAAAIQQQQADDTANQALLLQQQSDLAQINAAAIQQQQADNDTTALALLQAQGQLDALTLQQQNADALAALQAQDQMAQYGQDNSIGLIDGTQYEYTCA